MAWGLTPVPETPWLADYTALQAAVVDQIRDSQVNTTKAEDFIRQAQYKIQEDLLSEQYGRDVPRQMLARDENTSDADSKVPLPDDFLKVRAVMIANRNGRHVSPDKIRDSKGFGDQQVILDYYRRIPQMSMTNPSNWVLETEPNAYLYGACLFYVPWGQKPEILNLWQQFYTDAIQRIKRAHAPRGRGNIYGQKARPFGAGFTIIGSEMLFGHISAAITYRHQSW